MIEVRKLTKNYGENTAIEDIDFKIKNGTIFGLIGYNGAGKTTLLKTMCGIYNPEKGGVYIEDKLINKCAELRKRVFLLSEDPFFLPQSNLYRMRRFYRGYYRNWNDMVFNKLINIFKLDPYKNIEEFSKGMKKQSGLTLALSIMPKYLFLDEAFDGLDLYKRNIMKIILKEYVEKKDATVVITSHNLQELEDISSNIGMIKNKTMISNELYNDMSLEEFFLSQEEELYNELKDIF